MFDITPATVVQVILLAREGAARAAELHSFIAGLNDDEKAQLIVPEEGVFVQLSMPPDVALSIGANGGTPSGIIHTRSVKIPRPH